MLEEMNAFLQTDNLPTLNPEEIRNLNRSITKKNVESVVKQFLKKSLGPDTFTGDLNHSFKELTLLKLFLKVEEETLPNSFYDQSINLKQNITRHEKKIASPTQWT